jgi:hypothetical protein
MYFIPIFFRLMAFYRATVRNKLAHAIFMKTKPKLPNRAEQLAIAVEKALYNEFCTDEDAYHGIARYN